MKLICLRGSLVKATSCCLVVGVLAVGCSREVDPVYVKSAKVDSLAEPLQRAVDEILSKYYGTPVSPRLLVPGDETSSGDSEAIRLTDKFDPDRLLLGAAVYQKRCVACHGVTGDGAGPAAEYLSPLPRDYRRGIFKFISTPRGRKPRRIDLERTIRWGAKGTSMPSFRWLPDEELQAVIDYVTLLSQRGETERQLALYAEDELEPEDEFDQEEVDAVVLQVAQSWDEAEQFVVLPDSRRPPRTEASILNGRKAFLTKGCAKCHGPDARGRKENVGKDSWDQVAYAADITLGTLHGGRRPIDIYRRIHTGINGTPMPAFAEALKNEPETIWDMVYYVTAVVEGREFDPADVEKYLPKDDPAAESN